MLVTPGVRKLGRAGGIAPARRRPSVRALRILLTAAVAIACAPSDRAVRIERLETERRNLEATFDHLEDRLLVNQARVRFWQEMRERHESVSAIACASLDEHAEEMALRRIVPEPSSLHRSRVAAVSPSAERVPAAAAGRP
jgi:hypothetical protein